MTPARKTIEPEFLHFFYEFSTCNDVYLVTGSDRDKTIEQVHLEYTTMLREFITALVLMCMKGMLVSIGMTGSYLGM